MNDDRITTNAMLRAQDQERIAALERDLAVAQAENEKLREWQVRKNGEIIDLQGVLLDAEGKIERLIKEAAALRVDAERLKALHTNLIDAEGYEWGVYRVKWVDGRAVEVWQTMSDSSDLDAAIDQAKEGK